MLLRQIFRYWPGITAIGWIHCGKDLAPKLIPASSVPFFSEECGERFRDVAEFETRSFEFSESIGTF